MKKTFKIVFITLSVLIIILISVPYLFKGKILTTASKTINSNLNAEVNIGNLRLSFFKDFPNLSVELNDLSVKGKEDFSNDTLLYFTSFGVSVNAIKAINKEIDIKRIWLDQPVINAIVLEDSTANWDIAPIDTTTVKQVSEEDTSGIPDINMKLKSFEINGANIYYTDLTSDLTASLEDFNFNLTGDFSKDYSNLDVQSDINDINVEMDGISYMKNAFMELILDIDANLLENTFTLKQNSFQLNKINLAWDGMFKVPEEKPMEIDLNFETSETDFKDLLSMVPSIFMEGYEDLIVNGNFKIDGKISGKYSEEIMPDANIRLLVDKASFKYPDLPESVDNISIDLLAKYNGLYEDSTTVDLNKFHLEIAENPVDISFHLKKPFSDPTINILMKANMELADFKDALPMENTSLSGNVNLNLDMFGSVSMIENEQYDQFKADGYLDIVNLEYMSEDIPEKFILNQLECYFSPQYLTIDYLDAKMGESDFQFKGKLENYVPYALEDDVLKGNFVFTSNYLNVDQLMGNDTTAEEISETDTLDSEGVIEVPDNLNLKLHTRLNKVMYDGLSITDVKGVIIVNNGVATLEDLNMKMLEGEITLNGEYNTKDIRNPLFDFSLVIDEISIPQSFQSFTIIQEYVPIAKHTDGKFSANLSLASFLNNDMTPLLKSLTGEGSVGAKSLVVKETKVTQGFNSALSTDKFSNLSIKDFQTQFKIRNNRLFVDPFDINVGNINMNVSGDQGLDKTLNYLAKLKIPTKVLGNAATNSINSLASSAGFDIGDKSNINVNMLIGGTFSNPKITPKFTGGEGSLTESVKETVKLEVKEEVKKQKEAVKAVASEEADKIIAEAEKKAEAVRQEAKKLANRTKKEADAAADKLIEEAGNNPLAKKAAEISAKRIRDEGYQKARQIEDEADKKATNIVNKAKAEADKLK